MALCSFLQTFTFGQSLLLDSTNVIIVCLGSSWPLALIMIPSSTGKCCFSSVAMMLPILKGTRVEDAAFIIVWCLGVETDSEEPLGV